MSGEVPVIEPKVVVGTGGTPVVRDQVERALDGKETIEDGAVLEGKPSGRVGICRGQQFRDVRSPCIPSREDLIKAFKIPKEHGLEVVGTSHKEDLTKLLDRLTAPSLFQSLPEKRDLTVTVHDRVKTRDEGPLPRVSIKLPVEKFLEIAQAIEQPSTETAKEIEQLRDLEKRGMDLHLQFVSNPRYAGGERVKVTPEIFHWFMTHPVHVRRMSLEEKFFENTPLLDPYGLGFLAALVMHPFDKGETLWAIAGGYVDPKVGGSPNEALLRKNWEEFKKLLPEPPFTTGGLDRWIDQVQAREKRQNEDWRLFTGNGR